MPQDIAWQVSWLGIGIVAAAFAWVAWRASVPVDAGAVKKRWYRARPYWFALLVGAAAWASMETLPQMPYAATRGEAAAAALRVDVVGHKWRWEISRREVPVDTLIAFRVTAADVNHSFALYGPDGRVAAQVQAMPGYVNVLRHRFAESGRYTVRCLEYCGVAHHGMVAALYVRADGTEADR